jgi:hypothetical protein
MPSQSLSYMRNGWRGFQRRAKCEHVTTAGSRVVGCGSECKNIRQPPDHAPQHARARPNQTRGHDQIH